MPKSSITASSSPTSAKTRNARARAAWASCTTARSSSTNRLYGCRRRPSTCQRARHHKRSPCARGRAWSMCASLETGWRSPASTGRRQCDPTRASAPSALSTRHTSTSCTCARSTRANGCSNRRSRRSRRPAASGAKSITRAMISIRCRRSAPSSSRNWRRDPTFTRSWRIRWPRRSGSLTTSRRASSSSSLAARTSRSIRRRPAAHLVSAETSTSSSLATPAPPSLNCCSMCTRLRLAESTRPARDRRPSDSPPTSPRTRRPSSLSLNRARSSCRTKACAASTNSTRCQMRRAPSCTRRWSSRPSQSPRRASSARSTRALQSSPPPIPSTQSTTRSNLSSTTSTFRRLFSQGSTSSIWCSIRSTRRQTRCWLSTSYRCTGWTASRPLRPSTSAPSWITSLTRGWRSIPRSPMGPAGRSSKPTSRCATCLTTRRSSLPRLASWRA
mmetsp:Transcript_33263/g.106118  ORF Transcript_33263/g.106118 Transcript_33263/m.106118 type:complete len:445 (-) Transcript_33263:579-1913(-)